MNPKTESQLPSGNQAAQVGGIHSERRYLDTDMIDRTIQAIKQERSFESKVQMIRAQVPELAPLVDELFKAAPSETKTRQAGQ